jgi:hypothetical protein
LLTLRMRDTTPGSGLFGVRARTLLNREKAMPFTRTCDAPAERRPTFI